jgi:hypothetical protein
VKKADGQKISELPGDELLAELLRVYKEVRPTEGDRAAYIQALMMINGCLLEGTEEGMWFLELADALSELEAGIVWPVLQPAKINHRKVPALYIRYRRACVAVGVKALIRSGMSRENAAKEALLKVKTIRGTDHKTVLSWMDEFGKKRNATKPRAEYYTEYDIVSDSGVAECRDPALLRRKAERYFRLADRHSGMGETPSS